MKKYISLTLIILLNTIACTEKYKPELENVPSVLVVDGLITNEKKQHVITLSWTIPFDSMKLVPEKFATVYIEDLNKQRFYFKEKEDGRYYSDSISFEEGNTYTLKIKSSDLKNYISTPQTLMPLSKIENISSNRKTIEIYQKDGEKQKLSKVYGAELLTPIAYLGKDFSCYRFENSILVEYLSKKDGESINKFCWKKYNPNENFNINNPDLIKYGEGQHDLGFFPLDTTFYEVIQQSYSPPLSSIIIPVRNNLINYIISIKKYHINENIHYLLGTINKQLESSQRFFDPVASQIKGNIKCSNDASIKVFGLFEASSVSLTSYKINLNTEGYPYELIKISPFNMDSITKYGENLSKPPTFWIN